MSKSAITPKKTLCLVLSAWVWASLALLTLHELEHLAGQDAEELCPLCLATVGLDQLLATQPPSLALSFPHHPSCPPFRPNHFVKQPHAVPARGPPCTPCNSALT